MTPKFCPQCHQLDVAATLASIETRREQQTPDFAIAVSIARAAEIAGVSERTMNTWIDRGIVPSVQMGKNERRLIRVAALEEAIRRRETHGSERCEETSEPPLKTRGRQLRSAGE